MNVTDLAQELRELRQRLDDWPVPPKVCEGSFPPVKIEKDPVKPNYKLKPGKFPSFNGDRVTYAAWRRAVLSMLKIDWNTFDYNNSYVFLMIYNALEGKAQKQAASFFESGGRDGRQDPEEFIAFLDRSNWDPNRINRARGELNSMRMGKNQRWSNFFAQWANKLTEADGDRWPDDVKISQLRGKLNMQLRRAIANNHLLPYDDYFQWLKIVGQIAQQNDELAGECGEFELLGRSNQVHGRRIDQGMINESDNTAREWSKSGTERGLVGERDSTGDTFMGGVNSARIIKGPNGKPLRAKWKSPDQIRKLREEGKCYRCERKGCSTKICRLLPARKPEIKKGPEVNVNEFLDLDPSLYEEDEELGQISDSKSEN